MSRAKSKISLLFIFLVMFGLCSSFVGSEKGISNISADASGVENETIMNSASAETDQNSGQDAIKDSEYESTGPNSRGANEEDLEIPNESRILNLIQDLEDGSHETRLDAASELGEIGKPAADTLIEKLETEGQEPGDMNSYILLALLETGDERASEIFIRNMGERKEASAQAVPVTGNKAGKKMSEEMSLAVEAREKALRKKIVEELEGEDAYGDEALIQVLNTEKQDSRLYATIAVFERKWRGVAGDNETEELLLALESEYGCVRIAAAMALGEIKEERAVDELLNILGSDYDVVKSGAAYSLGKIGNERAVENLLKTLKHSESELVRSCSALALGEIGEERAANLLIQRLHDKEKDVRYSSILALGLIGDEKAVDPLLEILEMDRNSGVQDPMKKDTGIRKNAVIALGELRSNRSEETLIRILNDEEEKEEIRTACAASLGKTGSSEAVKSLISVVEDKKADQKIRSAALLALGETDDREAAEILIKYLDDPKLGTSAEKALKELGKTAVEPLIECLSGGNETLKTEASLLLIEMGDERAVEPLIQAYQ